MPTAQPNPFYSAIAGGLNEWANAMDPESLAKGNLYKANTRNAQTEGEMLASRLAYRRRLASMGLAPETEFALGASELNNPSQNLQTIHSGAAAGVIADPKASPQALARASQLQGNAYNAAMHDAANGIVPQQNIQVVEGANGDKYIVGKDGVPALWDKKNAAPIKVEKDARLYNPVPGPDGTYQELQTVTAPQKPPSWAELARFVALSDKQALGASPPDVATYVQQRLGLLDQDGTPLSGKLPLNPKELEAVVARAAQYMQGRNSYIASVEAAMRDLGLAPDSIIPKEWDNYAIPMAVEEDEGGNILPNLGASYSTSRGFRWDPATNTSPSLKAKLDTIPVPLQSVATLSGLGIEGAMSQVNNPIAAAPLPADAQTNPSHAGKYFYIKNGDEIQFVKAVLTSQGMVLVDQSGGKKAGP